MIKKEFILGLKVLSVKEYMNLSTFNSIPTLPRFRYHGAAIGNNQIDHKMLR